MLPFFQKIFLKLINDELFFRRWGRSLLFFMATGGLAFGDQVAAELGSPGAGKVVRIAAVLCGALAGAVTAGEKNK